MAVIQIGAQIDAMISQANPTGNFGANPTEACNIFYLLGSKTGWTRALANYDANVIPAGSVINSAKLLRNFKLVSGLGGLFEVISRNTRPATWLEMQATWNVYATGSPWTAPGGDRDVVTPGLVVAAWPVVIGWHTVLGLAAYVVDAIALRGGLVAFHHQQQDENPGVPQRTAEWYTRENATLNQYLEVDYTPPPAPAFQPQQIMKPPGPLLLDNPGDAGGMDNLVTP